MLVWKMSGDGEVQFCDNLETTIYKRTSKHGPTRQTHLGLGVGRVRGVGMPQVSLP